MAVTREAYDKKVKWLKPVKCELIAFILWPDALARDRKKAVALARMAKRWGGVRHFREPELETLKKHRKLLKEHRTLAKLKKAICQKEYSEKERKDGANRKVPSV